MNKELIYIGSVNKAFKAKEVLKHNGIESKIERSLSTNENGCGYSILLVESTEKAKEILKINGIIGES